MTSTLNVLQRFFGEGFAVGNYVIAVTEEQIGKRFVAAVNSFSIVVALVEENARKVFGEGRIVDHRPVLRIRALLGDMRRRQCSNTIERPSKNMVNLE